MKVIVTGANGFLGAALVDKLANENVDLLLVTRRADKKHLSSAKVLINNIDADTAWQEHLIDCDVIVHCAARVHMMHDEGAKALAKYREVNTQGTINLAQQAAHAGVKRFVFISSIKVLGEETTLGSPFKYNDQAKPQDDYGTSKLEAEKGLLKLAEKSEMQVVIIRPTLVYGPGVKANFLTMMKVLDNRIPLPFGAIKNKRSLLAMDNLVDLICVCLDHPKAANETFLVSDDRDVSTTELLKLLGEALGKKACLLPLPMWAIKFAAKIMGKEQFAQRLCSSLQVDIEHTKQTLGWCPPHSIEDAILKTAWAFQQDKKN